ncbi:DEAD/DEAH box helicase family protein [Bartonella sp. OT172YNZD]|uniref:DEAD/DEAH box helicase family protein n=1 Tax=Bartonella sp. OT172YNZD TaxID=3243572 RepID=UPI0035CFE531
MNTVEKRISARLSLRDPQRESLNILVKILENIELSKFERNFSSFCFALAKGVGKTRLMGSFISYFYLTGRNRHFFVLAPNLTIYEKLKQDFSSQSPKYVFSEISEFIANRPVIITGDDYESGKGIRVDDYHLSRTKAFV